MKEVIYIGRKYPQEDLAVEGPLPVSTLGPELGLSNLSSHSIFYALI